MSSHHQALWFIPVLCAVLAVAAQAQTQLEPQAPAIASAAIDTSLFTDRLYPLMLQVQCNLCHGDNGVASETELEFPDADASQEQIAAFGLWLRHFVDAEDPLQSPLLLKPTNREEHTGGERISPGSQAETILLKWVGTLAGFNEQQIQMADERIARARQLSLQPLSIRRLTNSQYNATVRDLLGDITQPANNFPNEDFVRGFKNQAEAQGISPLQAEGYAKAAERLSSIAFRGGDTRQLIPCQPASESDTHCAAEFVRQFGLRAFRRPLTDHEVTAYTTLFEREANRLHSFLGGAQIVIEAMLQSPHFLFRVQQADQGSYQQYEIASRLSYFLWNTMPSAEMLQAAARGDYAQPAQLEAAARRMLDDPRAQSSMEEFLEQWMRFDRVLTATRDRRLYGEFNSDVAAAMVEETKMLFNYLVWQDRDFMEFFTADYTFLSTQLAQLYGLPVPEEDFAMVKYLPGSGRSGVLGHASFLVATSKPAETSPTERGLFIRNHFLAQEVPPPPPGVNTTLPEITEDKPMTNRQRLQVHLSSEACSGCHRLIDPIGFGFEQYNAIGAFAEVVSIPAVAEQSSRDANASGPAVEAQSPAYIQGIENSAFSTPQELGQILANNEACQRCIVKQLFRYAFGREETASDQPQIDVMLKKFRDSGFQFRELIVAVVTSELFVQPGQSPVSAR